MERSWRERITMATGVLAAAALLAWPAAAPAQTDAIWDLQAVDADGYGTHPSLSLPAEDEDAWVSFQGVVLNEPNAMLDTAWQWQVYVQALAPAKGGIALYANNWYPTPEDWSWPRYPDGLRPGDVVQVEGLLMNYNGKVNLNERHGLLFGGDQFTVTVLSSGDVPAPRLIPDIAACDAFQQDRAAGGEQYQGQWCRLEDVRLTGSGGWGNSGGGTMTDDSGGTLGLKLGRRGGFDTFTAPGGTFNVSAIFDQEDESELPWDAGYRMWAMSWEQIELWGDTNLDGDVDLQDVFGVSGSWTGSNPPVADKAWADGDFNGDGDVDLSDVIEMSANWTGSRDMPEAPAGPMEAPLGPSVSAGAVYDPNTGEVVLTATGVESLMIEGEGLLTGEDPDWSFLTAGMTDDSDDFTGFWAMGNPQTFADRGLGAIAAAGMEYGDLTLIYEGEFGTGQVRVPVVPEPASLALVAAVLAPALIRRKRGRTA